MSFDCLGSASEVSYLRWRGSKGASRLWGGMVYNSTTVPQYHSVQVLQHVLDDGPFGYGMYVQYMTPHD